MKIDQIIVVSILCLISGIIGYLVAPWVKWGLEKKKLRYQNRKELIIELNKMVSKEKFDRVEFINSSSYQMVRKYFPEKTIKRIERPLDHWIVDVNDPAIDFERRSVLEAINKIQKKWKII